MSEFRVALAGDDGTVRDAAERAGVAVVDPAAADALVTVGEDALRESALDVPGAPLVPVAAGEGPHAVSRSGVEGALEALAGGRGRTVPHPLLSVRVADEEVGRALLDVSLFTSEPARISEYAVRVGDERLASFRSDGVVVATPAGSSGYARAAGGPVLEPGAGLSVVPVSPFAIRTDDWVVADAVDLSVERDDSDVTLFLDDRAASEVHADAAVSIGTGGTVEFLRPPADEPGERPA